MKADISSVSRLLDESVFLLLQIQNKYELSITHFNAVQELCKKVNSLEFYVQESMLQDIDVDLRPPIINLGLSVLEVGLLIGTIINSRGITVDRKLEGLLDKLHKAVENSYKVNHND